MFESEGSISTPAVADALAAAGAAVAGLGRVGWWQAAEGDLGPALSALQTLRQQLAAVELAVIREADLRGEPAARGELSTAAWVRGRTGFTRGQATAWADLASALAQPELAELDTGLARGAVGTESACVIARTMGELPREVDAATRAEAAQLLVDAATVLDPGQLRRLAARLRHRLDPDAGDRLAKDEAAAHNARAASLVQDSTGMWNLAARLDAIGGATLWAALEPLAAPNPATDGTPDPRTTGQRLADALIQIADHQLATDPDQDGALPTRAGARPRLVITADLTTLAAAPRTPGVPAGELAGGHPISAATVSLLACDAQLVPVLTDDGQPLDVGRAAYTFPTRIRTAITTRDRHCTFPGCDRPPQWCQAHHLQAFSRGGPTSERNGTLLCGRHHRYVHTTGWTATLRGDHVHWRPPSTTDTQDGNAEPAAPPGGSRHLAERALTTLAQHWITRNPHLAPNRHAA